MDGDFSYPRVSKGGVRHSPAKVASAKVAFDTVRKIALTGGDCWGKTYRKAKPCEGGPSEAIFRDPLKAVSEVVC